jgi:protein-S-isoprenylcysteine O-methyltransferase Ste14
MLMGVVALGFIGVFAVVCVGLRTWIHLRQTGDSPFRSGPAVAAVAVISLIVHRIEKPYLESVHGDAYRRWAASTGRFVPRVTLLGRR